MNLTSVKECWKPLLLSKLVNRESFAEFKENVLAKEKYYPKPDKVFWVFSLDINDIKAVKVINSPRFFREDLHAQGVFQLPLQFTEGIDNNHFEFWLPFVQRLVYFISWKKPSVWIFTKRAIFLKDNIHKKTQFRLFKLQDFERIHDIPINPYSNYLLPSTLEKEVINTLLTRLKKEKINW